MTNAIMDVGLDLFETCTDFDGEDIENLCFTTWHSGGTISFSVANGNSAHHVPNPGQPIVPVFEMKLKLAAYATNYYEIVRLHHYVMEQD